jgi:TRAP-type mannitol/chloroaromatic compound transport system substrate-binding protein
LLVEMTQEDESSKKIYESLSNFQKNVSQYHEISEEAIYELR